MAWPSKQQGINRPVGGGLGKVPKLPKTVAADMNAADEGLEGTRRPEVTPRVKANKSAMATLLSGRRG